MQKIAYGMPFELTYMILTTTIKEMYVDLITKTIFKPCLRRKRNLSTQTLDFG